MGKFLRKCRLTSAIILSILMNLQKVLKPCHLKCIEKYCLSDNTNIIKIFRFARNDPAPKHTLK